MIQNVSYNPHEVLSDVENERLVEAYESWESARQAGENPCLEDRLSDASGRFRSHLLYWLLRYEIECGRPSATPSRDDLMRRFPHDAAVIDAVMMTAPECAGARIEGYEIYEEIGCGGMGRVLRGRDLALNRELAFKVIHDGYHDRADIVKRFRAEAQITAQLQHPGVPPVHGCGTTESGLPYFCMRFIHGRELAELLRERPTPQDNLPQLLRIFDQVCQTMAYAHSQGVIHRDLKPRNIMVGAFGEVQVMDWGLAKRLSAGTPIGFEGSPSPSASDETSSDDSLADANGEFTTATAEFFESRCGTQPGQLFGTPEYIPPEQANGELERVDERADVFALGAILCEILTGRRVYTDPDRSKVIRMAKNGDTAGALQSLEESDADADLKQLARSCLSVALEERPANAQVLADQLQEYFRQVQERLKETENQLIAAKARAEAERRARRRVIVLASVIVASLLLLTLASVGLVLALRAQMRDDLRVARINEITATVTTLSSSHDFNHLPLSVRELHRLAADLDWAPGTVNALVDGAIGSEQRRAYVRGYLHLEHGKRDDLNQAIDWFNTAADTSQTGAERAAAYAGLAECYYQLSNAYASPDEVMPEVKRYAEMALQEDENCIGAHVLMGMYEHRYNWNWKKASSHFEAALKRDPQSAMTNHKFGYSLVLQKSFDRGIELLEAARRRDPYSPQIATDLALAYVFMGDDVKAERYFREAIALDSNHFRVRWGRGDLYLHKANWRQAIRELEQANRLDNCPEVQAQLAFCLLRTGDAADRERAEQIAQELKQIDERGDLFVSPTSFAIIQLGLKDFEQSLKHLNEGLLARDEWLVWLEMDPVFDELRNHPDFQKLRKKIDLWPAE